MKYKLPYFLISVLIVVAAGVWFFVQVGPFRFKPAEAENQTGTLVGQFASPTAYHQTQIVPALPTRTPVVGPYVSQQAPGFTLNTLEGTQTSLVDYRGKVVLLNFWASWCIPCKQEMPLIQVAYEKYHDQGFMVLGINMTELDERSEIDRFVEETGVTFPILLDELGSVSRDYRIISIPTSFFVDRTGVIRHFQLGEMSTKQLESYLDKMLP